MRSVQVTSNHQSQVVSKIGGAQGGKAIMIVTRTLFQTSFDRGEVRKKKLRSYTMH